MIAINSDAHAAMVDRDMLIVLDSILFYNTFMQHMMHRLDDVALSTT